MATGSWLIKLLIYKLVCSKVNKSLEMNKSSIKAFATFLIRFSRTAIINVITHILISGDTYKQVRVDWIMDNLYFNYDIFNLIYSLSATVARPLTDCRVKLVRFSLSIVFILKELQGIF
jgi:hypothetical protein